MRMFLLSAALLSALASQALADTPVYVVRPPVMQLKAGVLPATAFSGGSTAPSAPSTPSTPTTPTAPEYVFESYAFDHTTGTVKSYSANVGAQAQVPIPATGACDIADSATQSLKTSITYLRVGSKLLVTPLIAGKMAAVVFCDAVNGSGTYFAKIILTGK